jgi:hypothetical protein
VLQIFIALKNLLFSAGFEAGNLGFSGKNFNHYATENDVLFLKNAMVNFTETSKLRSVLSCLTNVSDL